MTRALAIVDQIDTFTTLRDAIRHLETVTPRLRNEVTLRYGTLTDQPRLQRKYDRDMAPIIEAELFIEHARAQTGQQPLSLDSAPAAPCPARPPVGAVQ